MKQSIALIIFIFIGMATYAQNANEVEQITMTTELGRSNGIMIEITGGSTLRTAVIDWGDGKTDSVRVSNFFGSDHIGHGYDMPGIYTITITGGDISYLWVKEQRLVNLDVSKSANLKSLNCSNNMLKSLDVSNNTKLTYLNCSNNMLTVLDVSKNINLEDLTCIGNRLTSLDVSKNTSLKELNCSSNQLTNLDINKNTKLVFLYVYHNRLTSLDASNNTELHHLSCNRNDFLAPALNALFGTLNNRNTGMGRKKTIIVYDNPGADSCDRTIAEKKGWSVTFYDPALE